MLYVTRRPICTAVLYGTAIGSGTALTWICISGKTASSFEKQTCEVPPFFQLLLNLCVLHLLEPKVNSVH